MGRVSSPSALQFYLSLYEHHIVKNPEMEYFSCVAYIEFLVGLSPFLTSVVADVNYLCKQFSSRPVT